MNFPGWIPARVVTPPDNAVVRVARIDAGWFYALGDARWKNGRWHHAIADAALPETDRPTHWKVRTA